MTQATTYSREQLIDALVAEYEWYTHDDYDEAFDNDADKYRAHLEPMTHEQLIYETNTDDDDSTSSLEDFMTSWS